MRTALFYDTETTGLPLFNDPSEDPRQPHIVQCAALLVDLDTRTMIAGFDTIVRPDGWTIPDDVAKIHGITTERASAMGVGEAVMLNMLLDLWGCAEVRIAHNETFDARIVRIAAKRYFGDVAPEGCAGPIADIWKAGVAECTARLATPICKLPPTPKMVAAGRGHYKTPNLSEAFQHFFGKPFEGAHSASADVQACMAVYFAIEDATRAGQVDQAQQEATA